MFPYSYEAGAIVNAPAATLFDYIDDPVRLSGHMSESSWRMGGGAMRLETDEGRGQKVGSRISLSGRMLGVQLALDEVIIERIPPRRKMWATLGTPKLLVVGHYRMGFEIAPRGETSYLRIFIEYALPEARLWRFLGRLCGHYYATWCTQRMLEDTVRHFRERSAAAAQSRSTQ